MRTPTTSPTNAAPPTPSTPPRVGDVVLYRVFGHEGKFIESAAIVIYIADAVMGIVDLHVLLPQGGITTIFGAEYSEPDAPVHGKWTVRG